MLFVAKKKANPIDTTNSNVIMIKPTINFFNRLLLGFKFQPPSTIHLSLIYYTFINIISEIAFLKFVINLTISYNRKFSTFDGYSNEKSQTYHLAKTF